MKIWLPDALYRMKPLLLILSGLALFYVSGSIFLQLIAGACLVSGVLILAARFMWSNTGTIKTNHGSHLPGQHKTIDVTTSDK